METTKTNKTITTTKIAIARETVTKAGLQGQQALIASYVLVHMDTTFNNILLHWRTKDRQGKMTERLYQDIIATICNTTTKVVYETIIAMVNKGLITADTNMSKPITADKLVQEEKLWLQKISNPAEYGSATKVYYRILPFGQGKKATIYTPEYLTEAWGIPELDDMVSE